MGALNEGVLSASASAAAAAGVDEDGIFRKLSFRILPILMFAYITAYIDRVNVGFAKLHMAQDLGFSDAIFGFGAGIFFLGYVLFEVPSNIILHKVGARKWLTRIIITWGLVSGLTMLVNTPMQFYIMRFLLGFAEAGFIPGIIYYISRWFPAQRRGRVMSVFYVGLALSGLIGGPLSGWIMQYMDGIGGLSGWKWTFIIEAAPALLAGILVFVYLKDDVYASDWLNEKEKAHLRGLLVEDKTGQTEMSLRAILTNRLIWTMCLVYFADVFAIYGYSFWVPTLIQNMGVKGDFLIGALLALPNACAVASMIYFGRSADKFRERRWHIVVLFVIGAIGLALSVHWKDQLWLGMFALCIANMGILSIPPLFWSLPTAVLGGVASAAGIAWISSFGNIAGFFGPYIVGYIKQVSGGTEAAIYALIASMIVGALLVLTIPAKLVNR